MPSDLRLCYSASLTMRNPGSFSHAEPSRIHDPVLMALPFRRGDSRHASPDGISRSGTQAVPPRRPRRMKRRRSERRRRRRTRLRSHGSGMSRRAVPQRSPPISQPSALCRLAWHAWSPDSRGTQVFVGAQARELTASSRDAGQRSLRRHRDPERDCADSCHESDDHDELRAGFELVRDLTDHRRTRAAECGDTRADRPEPMHTRVLAGGPSTHDASE